MKYKYKKSALTAQWIFVAICYFSMVLILYLNSKDVKLVRKMFFGEAGLLFAFITTYSSDYLNRSVEFCEGYARFSSFPFKGRKKPLSMNIMYEDIYRIDAVPFPVVGIRYIYVHAKNIPHKIKVSFCFSHYADLYANLCKFVSQANPDAVIDERLLEFVGREKSE